MEATLKPTCSDTATGRLMFRRRVRLDMIDTAERQIEHFKSMIKNYKAQIKDINRQIDRERVKEAAVSSPIRI